MTIDVRAVQSRIQALGHQWVAEENPITRLPEDARRRRLGANPPAGVTLAAREHAAAAQVHALAATAPPSYDARALGWVTPVVDQGGCGSCVAFGTTATVESAVRIDTNRPNAPVSLSEAQVFYCYGHAAGATCATGWWPDGALNGFKQGVVDAACFPYTAGDQPCTLCSDSQARLTKITAWHTITSTADMKSWLASRGPMTTCFTVYNDFFAYRSGVYRADTHSGVAGGHCVCVVGYNDPGGFWICKNSWGTGWGEQGFFCIAYGQCGIDAEMWAVDGVVLPGPVFATPRVAAGRNSDGRLESFAVASDRTMWNVWQQNPHAGPWSSWNSLGGVITDDPTIALNSDGRLELFARGTDNALWHTWQQHPHAGPWSGWSSLGGVTTSNAAVVCNTDGRLEAFARGSDNALWHIWQQNAHAGPWSGWASLGGVITSDPSAVVNSDGRVEVFARGSDGALWNIWQTQPHAGPWSGWNKLGGTLTSNPCAGVNSDGRVEVFVRGTDNALYNAWQQNPHSGPWSGWNRLGGTITSDPAVALNSDGRLEVFARGTDHALWHIWQQNPHAGPWSSWASLGGVIVNAPSPVVNTDGRIEVFAPGTDHRVYHIWQQNPHAGPWSGWAAL